MDGLDQGISHESGGGKLNAGKEQKPRQHQETGKYELPELARKDTKIQYLKKRFSTK